MLRGHPSNATGADVDVRRLSTADRQACIDLAGDREWPPERHKWGLLLDVGEGFGIDDPDGGLAGCVVLTRFGSDLAAISMMLVASRYGRRGFGRRLMEHAMAAAGDVTIGLYATSYGRPLYERLGFEANGAALMHFGRWHGEPASGRSRPADAADLPAIIALDTEVTGADRAALIRRLPSFSEGLRVLEDHATITGYAGTWRNGDNLVVGPVIANNLADARALIADLVVPADISVRLDLDPAHSELVRWALHAGLTHTATSVSMVHNGPLRGDRARLFIPVMQALG